MVFNLEKFDIDSNTLDERLEAVTKTSNLPNNVESARLPNKEESTQIFLDKLPDLRVRYWSALGLDKDETGDSSSVFDWKKIHHGMNESQVFYNAVDLLIEEQRLIKQKENYDKPNQLKLSKIIEDLQKNIRKDYGPDGTRSGDLLNMVRIEVSNVLESGVEPKKLQALVSYISTEQII
jgi:hypothetical protein